MKLRQIFPTVVCGVAGPRRHRGRAAGSAFDYPRVHHLGRKFGFDGHILPTFTRETGATVHVLTQGTGEALQTAARNDADLVLVHDPEAEQKFISAGDGIDRRQIAWNDFIVVGPRSDPAHIAGSHDAVAALKAIASAQAPSVSRGDKSGTDALEHHLWRVAGSIPPKPAGDRGTAISAVAWVQH
jgi:tungstate transport system substrate-binding protein